MPGGPQPLTHADRVAVTHELARQLQAHYGARIMALGVYGSLARQLDGPYSDIEMHCVLEGTGIDHTYEWCNGAWKAEIDVVSPDVLWENAATIEGDWPITHGSLAHVWPLYDPNAFFDQVRTVTLSQPGSAFRQAIYHLIVDDLYELIGKIRNAGHLGYHDALPMLLVELARVGACLGGLHHRHLYTTGARLWQESLTLPDRPEGYDEVCRLVQTGRLDDPPTLLAAAEAFWDGVETWAARQRFSLETTLSNLLEERPADGAD